jgi:hypothetical protein
MRVRGVLVLLVMSAVQACDPCSGVANCDVTAYLAVDGQIVDPVNGVGIDGVPVGVVRIDGVAVDVDSVSTRTADGGHWRVELSPHGPGTVYVEVVVSPPGYPSYRVPLTLVTRTRGGDATLLDKWVPEPYFSYAGELYLNGTADERVNDAAVEFRRTGGVQLRGPGIETGVFRTRTDIAGRFTAFPTVESGVFPVTFGNVFGEFRVDLGPPYGVSIVRNVVLSPTPVYRKARDIYRAPVGPGT